MDWQDHVICLRCGWHTAIENYNYQHESCPGCGVEFPSSDELKERQYSLWEKGWAVEKLKFYRDWRLFNPFTWFVEGFWTTIYQPLDEYLKDMGLFVVD